MAFDFNLWLFVCFSFYGLLVSVFIASIVFSFGFLFLFFSVLLNFVLTVHFSVCCF